MIYVITDTIITYLGYNISMRNFEKNIRDDASGPWDILKGVTFSESSEGHPIDSERLSKKPLDVFVRRVFELNPELKSTTLDMLRAYSTQNKKLPFLHITPNIIEYESGEYVSTGNVDSIKNRGFYREILMLAVLWLLENIMIASVMRSHLKLQRHF